MATEITGRIGLLRAEDSTGCVVAIDGHWFDVADILAEPDVGLVQLHGVSSSIGSITESWTSARESPWSLFRLGT